jgi:GTP-binding protein EngB required for normal cell division
MVVYLSMHATLATMTLLMECVSIAKNSDRYLLLIKRKELALGILLVDVRRVPSDDDRAVLTALYDMGVPILVVATKIDKIGSKNMLEK